MSNLKDWKDVVEVDFPRGNPDDPGSHVSGLRLVRPVIFRALSRVISSWEIEHRRRRASERLLVIVRRTARRPRAYEPESPTTLPQYRPRSRWARLVAAIATICRRKCRGRR